MHHIEIPGLSISQWNLAHDVTKLFRDFQTKIALWDGNAVTCPIDYIHIGTLSMSNH